MCTNMDESDDQIEFEDGLYSRASDNRPRQGIWGQDGHGSRSYEPWTKDMTRESSSSLINRSRPSTAPANLYNYENQFSRPQSFRGSTRSSSRKSSPSRDSDINCDDAYSMSPGPDQTIASDLSLLRTFNQRCTLSPSEYSSERSQYPDTYRRRKRSRSLYRNDIQRRQGPAPEGWGVPCRQDVKALNPYLYQNRRLSMSPPCAEDRTHIPAPDHRRVVHHSFVGGYGSYCPTARSRNFATQYGCPLPTFSPKRSRRTLIPWDAPDPKMFYTSDGDLFFTPCRGDVIIVKPDQRGRMPDRFRPREPFGCVRSFTGSAADFVFRSGDLIVRIGTYATKAYLASVSYIPYRILELYRRHDGVWKFLGDAHTEENLGEKRRNGCVETQPSVSIVGEISNIEPNYGDFIIRQDKIRGSDEELSSTSSIIEWWTPYIVEELNRVYLHNTILLRPYVGSGDFLQARECWLGRQVSRVNRDRRGKVEEGIVVKIWPESTVGDGPLSTLRDWETLEVLGPDRVGVRVRNPGGCEVEVAWPLSSTFLESSDRPLSAYLSVGKRTAFRNDPWGSIEIYIHSAEVQPPVGWVYWGSSKHICDTPHPSRSSLQRRSPARSF